MKNVTTNEHLRKKWNATQSQNDQQTSYWDKIKQYYFKPLPKSRLQHYCEIRDAIFDRNDIERSSSEISLIDNNSLLLEYGIDLQMWLNYDSNYNKRLRANLKDGWIKEVAALVLQDVWLHGPRVG